MRFSIPSLATLVAMTCANSEAAVTKNSFMQSMRTAKISNGKKERKASLFASVLSAAKPVPAANAKRGLAYYDDDVDDAYDGYGFDISAFSLKYAGCSSISSYSDDLAADEDASTVFETDQYVVFRFCPSDTCQSNSSYGCMDSYGEYMVPMETWGELMATYREEELETYCDYCEECVGNNNNRERKLYYDDANNGDDGGNKYYGDDAAQGDDGNAAQGDDGNAAQDDDGYNDCAYASECSGYADVCYNQNNIDYSKFFECREYEVSDDLTLYIGAHCASDKSSISLGVYTDQYCTEFAGNKYDIGTLTGEMLTSDSLLDYYNPECVACKESDLPFKRVYADNDDADDITEVCENLYGYSAKCNRHISGATSKSYQSYEQEDNEYAVCSYIASVVTGSYDENGYIYVNPLSFEADNKYNQYSTIAVRKQVVTADQILGLTVFSFIVLGMSIHASLLHNKISQKAAMVETSKPANPAANLQRENSGIMMARSTTIDSTYQPPGQMA